MRATELWNKFTFEYNLDRSSLFTDLISVEAYRQAAINLVLAPEWRDRLDKLNRIRAVYGTTALEGNALSEAEVAHQIDLIEQERDAPNGHLTKEQLQIRNAARAQAWVKKRFEKGSPPLSLEDILKMHEMITQQSDENHNVPGKFRTFSVTVGSPEMGGVHRGAPHESLPELMERFVSFVNVRKEEEHPVIRGLLAHFFLVTIHPFGDGNGRVSRLLEAGILFRRDYNIHGFYGLSNFFYRNEGDYKVLLQGCRQSMPFNLTPFISFGVKGFAAELAGINNFIKTKINRVVYRQMLVTNYNRLIGARRRLLNNREYNLLQFLLDETEPLDPFSESPSRVITFSQLRESPYVKATYKDVTPRTFYRELLRLEEFGFIKFSNGAQTPKSLKVELDFEAISKYEVS
jgi:Fic family protein